MQWYDLHGFSEKLIELVQKVATFAKIGNLKIMLIAAVIVTVAVGILGFRMKSVVMAGLFGVIGFLVGLALFSVLKDKLAFVSKAEKLVKYGMGAAIAIAMAVLAWVRYKFAMFAIYAYIGYTLIVQNPHIPNKALLVFGAALLLGLLSALLPRFAFILLSSATGGFGTVIFLSAILPSVGMLQLGTSKMALIIAAAVTASYMGIQYLIRPRFYKTTYFALQFR